MVTLVHAPEVLGFVSRGLDVNGSLAVLVEDLEDYLLTRHLVHCVIDVREGATADVSFEVVGGVVVGGVAFGSGEGWV